MKWEEMSYNRYNNRKEEFIPYDFIEDYDYTYIDSELYIEEQLNDCYEE